MLKPKPDPLKDLLAIQQQINKLFEEHLQRGESAMLPATAALPASDRGWAPAVDAWETDRALTVEVELPGFTERDVTASIEDGVLTVRGERKKPAASGVRSFHRLEREHGSFIRAFSLPKDVSRFDVETRWADGVLHVTVWKSRSKSLPRKKK